MKLTCPECTTQFAINPEAIGPNGRTVRCSQCSATWYVAADPDVLDLQDHLADAQAQREAGLEVVHSTASEPSLNVETTSLESSVFENNVLDAVMENSADGGPMAPHVRMRDQADRKKVRRRLAGVGMIWGVTFAILGTAALAAFLFRGTISERFPVTQQMYEAFGISIPVKDLVLNVTGHSYGELDGQQILTVSGRIKNTDTENRDVPLVELSFKDAAGTILASWVVEPERSILKPEESIGFETQYPNPPENAANLVTNFVQDAGGISVNSQDELPVVTQ